MMFFKVGCMGSRLQVLIYELCGSFLDVMVVAQISFKVCNYLSR